MPIVISILLGLGLVIAIGAIGSWGVVQLLDIMEALDLRRAERKRVLNKARGYLRNPQGTDDTIDRNQYGSTTQTVSYPPYTSGSGTSNI